MFQPSGGQACISRRPPIVPRIDPGAQARAFLNKAVQTSGLATSLSLYRTFSRHPTSFFIYPIMGHFDRFVEFSPTRPFPLGRWFHQMTVVVATLVLVVLFVWAGECVAQGGAGHCGRVQRLAPPRPSRRLQHNSIAPHRVADTYQLRPLRTSPELSLAATSCLGIPIGITYLSPVPSRPSPVASPSRE